MTHPKLSDSEAGKLISRSTNFYAVPFAFRLSPTDRKYSGVQPNSRGNVLLLLAIADTGFAAFVVYEADIGFESVTSRLLAVGSVTI